MDIEVLMKKGKNAAAAYIQSECCRTSIPETLKTLLDFLLDPLKDIDNWDTIEWCKRLMAGSYPLEEFASTVRKYDNATTCGLVWTANFVAYRCRTCGISPCMSLCAECFKRGDHNGHDFNMFRSQAGGACDCGDTNVMKESGFCFLHGPHAQDSMKCPNSAPPDLLAVANAMMPRLILRLCQYMREHSNSLTGFLVAIENADKFITMLYEMSSMGAAMRQVMTHSFTNPQVYKSLIEVDRDNVPADYYDYMSRSKRNYDDALLSLPNPEPPEEYKDIPSLQKFLVHRTFLEELVFWTAKFEFPQKVVCLLLNLLPDADYKEAFTRAFVLHYSRISQLLVHCQNPDLLSNRVVHVSVQLFSNEKLALRMCEEMGLLHVMVISLKYMMSAIAIQSTLHNKDSNAHHVVDCGHLVMKDHCYWPLVSDLNNILSHRPVAMKFLQDDGLIKMWFNFLSLFQGMNVNQREMNQHIEFEPSTYYAAFSAELEASASPMWALVSHLRDESTAHLTRNLLRHCRTELRNWLESINYDMVSGEAMQVTFHLPLHRYFSVFLYQAVKVQGLRLDELLPNPSELLAIVQHPLRVQVAFYEIITGLWVRNGLQIKGQAMTYVQCHFCNSMVDADLFLLQVAMMNLNKGEFISSVLEKFHVLESFSLSAFRNTYLEPDQEVLMMENCLIFLSTLVSVRTSLGMEDSELVTLEMITLLCMADKTHSQLMELMPERCGNSSQSRDFENVLAKVADYRAPNFESSGNMFQGMYVPKPFVWETVYDPIYILLRAIHRRDFQTSLDRFTEYAKQSGKFKGAGSPWPPYKKPGKTAAPYTDPRNVLSTRVLHSVAFIIFYKAVNSDTSIPQPSDQMIALAIFLLEMALSVCDSSGSQVAMQEVNFGRYDMNFSTWFNTDSLFANLITEVDSVLVQPYNTASDSDDADISEIDMEVESLEDELSYHEFGSGAVATLHRPEWRLAIGGAGGIETGPRPLALMAANPGGANLDQRSMAALRAAEERRRHRNLQLILAPVKPVVSVQRMDVERSTGTGASGSVEVPLKESIISLLLKLHSKLSSAPDSYVPFWDTPEAEEIISSPTSGLQCAESQTTSSCQRFSYAELYSLLNGKDGGEPGTIGDGPFFVKKLLDQIGAKDEACRLYIIKQKEAIWPKTSDDEGSKQSNQKSLDKKRLAQESREKLMRDMKKKMDAFNSANRDELYMEGDISMGSGSAGYSPSDHDFDQESMQSAQTIKPIEYDCVICNQTSPSTRDNPVGLVILLQASSTLGHRRRMGTAPNILPTSDEEQLTNEEAMTFQNDYRFEEFRRNFDDSSWLMSLAAGWEGGIHVQTCGHHIHHECLKGYLSSLKSQQRQHNISVDRGEYSCPICRQLANSFLPLSSEFGSRQAALVKDHKTGYQQLTPEITVPEIPSSFHSNIALEVMKLLKDCVDHAENSMMIEAMKKTMEEMTNITPPKFRKMGAEPQPHSIMLFLNSIARTNLELEIVHCGGNLLTVPSDPQPSTSNAPASSAINKRSCLVPLLDVLGVHYKILAREKNAAHIWERLLGIRFLPDASLNITNREVPFLLRDASTVLIHLLLNLPMHVDLAYFTSIVQGVYNLHYVQVLSVISCRLREKQREEWKAKKSLLTSGDLNELMGTVIGLLEKSPLYIPDSDFGELDNYQPIFLHHHHEPSSPPLSKSSSQNQFGGPEDELEFQVEELLLPYLRLTALLRHYIYEEELPVITSVEDEFSSLGEFLSLGTFSNQGNPFRNRRDIGGHEFLNWITPEPLLTIQTWCEDLCSFISRSQVAARKLILQQCTLWSQPKLLDLPHDYDVIFQYFHRKQCSVCNTCPKDPSLCLICGTFVCMRDLCCKQNSNLFEATSHSINCGAGTAIYLSVHSSTIVVVRGKRACLWGSVYLDSFGEEDRELKRGKPLFLSKERYALLQQQWLHHRFDHTARKWIFHRDTL